MMSNTLFSVIIPTYNRGQQLLNAVNSLVNQSYSNWECIIIDDGSTDNTKNLINEHFKDEPRVKYFIQTNQERSAARNNGIEKSQGDFICFLDSDDFYDRDYLNTLSNVINQTNAELLFTSARYHNGQSTKLIIPTISDFELDSIFSNSIVVGRCCVKKSTLNNIWFEPAIRISEDTIFLCDIVARKPVTAISESSILEYIEHEDNSVNYKKYNAYSDRLVTLKYLLTRPYADLFSRKTVNQTLNNCYFGITKYYFYQGEFIKARITILKALLKYPTIRFKEKFYLFLFIRKKELHQ